MADDPYALVIEHSASDGAGSLARWLPEAGLELRTVKTFRGEAVPADLGDAAALIVLGGYEAAYEQWPGRDRELALIRSAVAAGAPVLGICLGHQLLAAALGGTVHRHPDGLERGACAVTLLPAAADDVLLGGHDPGDQLGVVQFHDDEVAELPEGAVLLASSPHTRVQAFRVGESAWGIQGHPEAEAEMVATWAREIGVDAADVLPGVRALDAMGTWRPVLIRFAALVRQRSPLSTAGL